MQHEHGRLKSHRVHRSIGAAGAEFDDLNDAGIAKAAQHLAVFVSASRLREILAVTKYVNHHSRQRYEILLTAAHPYEWLYRSRTARKHRRRIYI